MSDSQPSYRAVCFDLDGTLLPMDIDEFMKMYFGAITAFFVRNGVDKDDFLRALNAGIKAMAKHADGSTNAEAFFVEFNRHVDPDAFDWVALFNRFYDEDFKAIGEGFAADPHAAAVVDALAGSGYPLVLTTMPMFPLAAVEHRLVWAGVDPTRFARITSFENSRSVKPQQTYYAENLAAMGLAGDEVLMIGNNTMEDLSFMDLGADAWLVTDWMIDPLDYDLSRVKHGSLADLLQWAQSLPACADPAQDIERGAVSVEDIERAFADNARAAIDREEAIQRSEAVADIAVSFSDGGDGRSFEEAAEPRTQRD